MRTTCPCCATMGLPEKAEPLPFDPIALPAMVRRGLRRWTLPVVCGYCGTVYCKRNLAPEEKADFERLANEAAEEGDPDVLGMAGRALEGGPRAVRDAEDILRQLREKG